MVDRMRRALAALLVTLSSAASTHAFVPEDGGGLVVARGAPARLHRTVVADGVAGWEALRDRETGVVTRMWGKFVVVPGAIADAAIAERAARAFVAQHLAELAPGARIADFVVAANRVDDGKRTVAFVQTWNGLRVVGGQLHVVFGREAAGGANDRLFVVGSEALPNVQAVVPRTRTAVPLGRARAWLPGAVLRATGERVVLPIVRAGGGIAYHVADVIDARAGAQRWDVYVALDGEPLARASRTYFATSTLHLDVGARFATGARVQVPAAEAQITVDGAATTTAADGSFSWPTAAPAAVVTSLTGPRVRVVDEAGSVESASLTAQPGQPVVWSAAADELADAQLSAFSYATAAKVIGKRINPALAWLDQQLAVHVNLDSACNAFSTGDSIHFFRASADCENTARVADVVHHELGHSFHQQSLIPGAGAMDASIVEGIADFFAANITADPGVGRGFFFSADAVRELEPIGREAVYPRDLSGVSHVTGLIIGGALWDLREQLIAKLGPTAGLARAEKIFLGIVQRAGDLAMTYNAALVADDDDGDLGNGTPNFCTIESAFGRHGLAGPAYVDTTLERPVVDGRRVSVTVTTPSTTGCPRAQVTSMKLAYRVGDTDVPLTELAMTAAGATWSAELPDLPAGTVVHYQVVATLDTVETVAFPDNPADPLYQLFIGPATEIWCERFDGDPMWMQDGAREWHVAVSNPANADAGDPPAAFAGTRWLGTDLTGDGFYSSDIQTSITSPAIDARSYGRVHLQYRRWLGIEDAANDVATVRVDGTQIWANATTTARSLEHVDREWRFVDHDITAFAGSPFAVSWTLASNASRVLGGWNLDEICVVGLDKQPRCGDGVVDDGEACDDTTADCTPECQLVDEGGGCCSTSNGLPSAFGGLGLLLALLFRRRPAPRSR